jgi:arsenate reductase-like glutaredoxin family protein
MIATTLAEAMTVEELLAVVTQTETERRALREQQGKAIAALNRKHGMPFALIALRTGVPRSTIYHMAKPYL